MVVTISCKGWCRLPSAAFSEHLIYWCAPCQALVSPALSPGCDARTPFAWSMSSASPQASPVQHLPAEMEDISPPHGSHEHE